MENFSIVTSESEHLLNHPNFSISRPGLYPSEASVEFDKDGFHFVEGKCLRAVYYRVKKYNKDRERSLSLEMKAIAGKAIEEVTIDRWKRMGIWMGNSIKFFSPEFVVSGEVDGIIHHPDDINYLIGVEIKTFEGHYPSREILGSKKPPKPGQPKPPHFLQAMTYAWEYRDILSEFRIYYSDRGGGPRAEFRIGTEEQDGKNVCWRENIDNKYWNYTTNRRIYYPYAIEDIHDRFRKLVNYLRKDIIPPCDYGFIEDDKVEYLYSVGELAKKDYEPWKKDPNRNRVLDWQCKYCDYAGQCKSDSASKALEEELCE